MHTHRLTEANFRDDTMPVTTSAGITIGAAYRKPMPQPSADAEMWQRVLLGEQKGSGGETALWWVTVLGCAAAGLVLTVWGGA